MGMFEGLKPEKEFHGSCAHFGEPCVLNYRVLKGGVSKGRG